MIASGTRVRKGYYFSAKSWSMQLVPRDGEVLQGIDGEKHLHVPIPMALVLAPVMGALLVVFLPLAGIYLAANAAVRPVARFASRSFTELAATLNPDWHPGEAHLTGQGNAGDVPRSAAAPGQDPLAALEKEIAERRRART